MKLKISKEKKIGIALMLFLLALFTILNTSYAYAAPPVLSTIQQGSLEILAPTYNYVTQNADKDIYWHVFNTSNLLTNTTATCDYHLYSQNLKGEHIVTINNVKTFTNGRDFEVEIKGGNFSTIGEYCHLIECNTSSQTGGIERCFTVTSNGKESTEAKASFFFSVIIIFIIIAIFFFALGFIFQSPAAKIFFYFMSGVMLIFLMAVGLELTKDSFIGSSMESIMGYVWFLTITLLSGAIIIGIIFAIITAYEALMDKKGFKE